MRSGFVGDETWLARSPKVRTPTMVAIVSVRSKCGRVVCVRASRIKRRPVVNRITVANATMNDKPATPVNSAIWISGQLPWSATPRPFQPQPEKTQPRNHSCAVHPAARRKARTRLFADFVDGDRGGGAVVRALANL